MKRFVLALALTAVFATAVAAGETIALPSPLKKGGPDLFTAIDKRSSAGQADFPKGDLSRQDMATILWATTGLNRDGQKWTVPMAMGVPPYCKVYYADKSGAYLYDWKNHALIRVSSENIVSHTVTQEFAKKAPALLFVVEDSLEKGKIPSASWKTKNEFTILLAGAMSQNTYLAAQGVGVGARLVYSVDHKETSRRLNLEKGDKPLFAIVLGKNK